MPSVFVTGGTGFIGRHVVARLAARGVDLTLLQRPASAARWSDTIADWDARARDAGARVTVVHGDVREPGLGADDSLDLARFDVVLHLAGLYDLAAAKAELDAVNVEGTRHVIERLEQAQFGGLLVHASSTAVAGDYDGTLAESDLDVGQKHPHPYHRSKFEAEQLVRSSQLRTRIVRPSAVVGDTRTGAVDRIDGPYYLFKPIQRLRAKLPQWWPLIGFTKEPINMVPVDYVADAIVHLMFADGLDGKTFHLVDPAPPRFYETYNLMADAAGAPRIRSGLGARLLKRVPPGAKMAGQLASVKFLRDETLRDWGIPPQIVDAVNRKVAYDTAEIDAATAGTDVRCPPQSSYVARMWDYWVRNLDPDRDPAGKRAEALRGKKVLITGASSGVGLECAKICAESGALPILVARREPLLVEAAAAIRDAGGECAYYVADLNDFDAIDELCARVLAEHGTVDVLVNNAARSIRRRAVDSIERFHDFERTMRLNYFAPIRMIRGLLPAMIERRSGAIINVLSAGAGMPTPNFGAYMATKAALGSITDTLGVELMQDGVFTSAIYLPWVRTDMMGDAFKDNVDVMTPRRAAEWVLDSIPNKQRHVANFTAKRRYVFNVVAPLTLSRLLNVFWRISADDEDDHPEFAVDRMIAKRFIKGKLM